VKQCAILFVNPDRQDSRHPEALRSMGFLVEEVTEWPDDNDMVRNYHVVIVRMREMSGAPMLAARLRAKPHFGRRLLVALVAAETSHAERRAAETSGFDDVMSDCCDTRHLTTRILRVLRTRSELRCALPPLPAKRTAA
jgi:DNA-binding response OmpR family regulator